jgi:hypothetical protein
MRRRRVQPGRHACGVHRRRVALSKVIDPRQYQPDRWIAGRVALQLPGQDTRRVVHAVVNEIGDLGQRMSVGQLALRVFTRLEVSH